VPFAKPSIRLLAKVCQHHNLIAILEKHCLTFWRINLDAKPLRFFIRQCQFAVADGCMSPVSDELSRGLKYASANLVAQFAI
jgi:hypothetical protein